MFYIWTPSQIKYNLRSAREFASSLDTKGIVHNNVCVMRSYQLGNLLHSLRAKRAGREACYSAGTLLPPLLLPGSTFKREEVPRRLTIITPTWEFSFYPPPLILKSGTIQLWMNPSVQDTLSQIPGTWLHILLPTLVAIFTLFYIVSMYNKVYHLPSKIKKILISLFFPTYSIETNTKFYHDLINIVKLPNKKKLLCFSLHFQQSVLTQVSVYRNPNRSYEWNTLSSQPLYRWFSNSL